MDATEQNQINEKQPTKLELSDDSIISLNETRKWANFLAILGFIFFGFMLLFGLFSGMIFSRFGPASHGLPFPGFVFGLIYIVFGLIYFFPVLYLFNFANWTKKALNSSDANDLNLAFRNLKAHYRYIGILAIIFLGFYALFIIIFLAAGLITKGMWMA